MPAFTFREWPFPAQDLTGKKWHKLTALRFLGWRVYGKSSLQLWEWRCDCGTVKPILSNHVRCGHVKGCGCQHPRFTRIKDGKDGRPLRETWKQVNARRRDKLAAWFVGYYAKNRERIRAKARQNKAYFRLHASARRAKVRAVTTDSKAIANWFFKIKQQRVIRCYYCGGDIHPDDFQMEHIIPITRGGLHCVSNLAASCVKCNVTKNAKTPGEWKRIGQQFLSL